jgi:hypothetical protein
MRMHYQQYFKYCGGPSIATIQQWQPYNITKHDILLDMIILYMTDQGHPQL